MIYLVREKNLSNWNPRDYIVSLAKEACDETGHERSDLLDIDVHESVNGSWVFESSDDDDDNGDDD